MRSFLIRLIIIVSITLFTATWYPFSLLPIWIMLLAMHFFSIREGVIFLGGFSLFSALLNHPFSFFFLLWFCFVASLFIKMLSPNGKIAAPQFIFLCLIISIATQILLYPKAYGAALITTIRHLLLISILILPTKILGDAYQRYFNALGRNYE